MSNAFRRTTHTNTDATKKDDSPPKPRNPFIVGTYEWNKFNNNGRVLETVTRNSIYTSKRVNAARRQRTREEIVKNSALIDKVLNFTYENGWMQIEGGENDGKWINTKYYGNKIFQSGKIYEYANGESHYFPISDTFDDPVGIALNFKNIIGAGMYCTVEPNTWTGLVTRASIKKRKRAERKEKEHIDNHDIAHKD